MYYHDYPMMDGYHTGWGFVTMLFGLFVIVVVTLVVVRMLRGDTMHHHMQSDNSLNIAKERYAKGEITKQEFEQLKKDLK